MTHSIARIFRALFFSGFLALLGSTTVYAQSGTGSINTQPISNFSNSLIGLLNTVVVPLVFAVAFLVFIWGVYNYFILGGANAEKRAEGSKFVLSALVGFVLMISIWGIVQLLLGTFPGLKDQSRPALPCFSGNCPTQAQQPAPSAGQQQPAPARGTSGGTTVEE